jgi:site-specific recombinase XerC
MRDIRDRALLLVGFAGAFRRAELSAIQRDWIHLTEHGISIALPKSKTDQESKGRNVVIPQFDGPICPVTALEVWLELSEIVEGSLFRRISKSGKILTKGLSANAIATIVDVSGATGKRFGNRLG